MGHACEILTFEESMSKNQIKMECDDWANMHCDPYERGGCYGGLDCKINFTDKVFEDYRDAVEYLDSTFGDYREEAVRFKRYPNVKPTKTMQDLKRRIMEYRKRISDLEGRIHYKGVKQATVKCKRCGSSLATAYCGVAFGYGNKCPVCSADLRPKSTLDKLAGYKRKLHELQTKFNSEQKKQNIKNAKNAKLFWAVACEVHC